MFRPLLLAAVVLIGASGCGTSDVEEQFTSTAREEPTEHPEPTVAVEIRAEIPTEIPVADNDGLFPTVVGARAVHTSGETWNFSVTLLSEYDTPERYADAWRVLDGEDNELGIRVLGHDHAGEQPFTRSTNVDVPADVMVVYVEARDQLNGWNGERFEVILERS